MEITKKNISVPRSVFQSAERLSKRLGMSLSELYTAALSAYIEDHATNSSVTEKLNEVYQAESSSIDPQLVRMQVDSVGDETRQIWKG